MPQKLDFFVAAVLWQLKNDLSYAKAVRWPELEALEASPRRLTAALENAARKRVRSGFPKFFSPICSIDPETFAARQLSGPVEHHRLAITFEPPRNVAWTTPVTLDFDAVLWPVQNFWIAAIPILDIEMQVKDRRDLDAQLEKHVRRFLAARHGADFGLEQILAFRELHASRFVRIAVSAEIPTFQDNVRLEHGRSLRTGTDDRWLKLGVTFFDSNSRLPEAYGFEPLLDRIAEEIRTDLPRPILLVGPGGVGKTALWLEFVRRLRTGEIKTNREIRCGEVEIAQLISPPDDSDDFSDGDWQSHCDLLVKLAASEGALLHFGNLWELTQVGMAQGQTRSLASRLIPAAAGRFPPVCECTAEQLAVMEQEQPGILFPFHRIDVEEPDEAMALDIYRHVAETDYPGRFDDDAIKKLDALHRRYATYSAAPGRALRFLHHLAASPESAEETVTTAGVTAAFSRETGLPPILLEDSIPLHAGDTADWFRRRIIGQDEAIPVIVDLLLAYKARLTRPDRPIASLLFVGPTGVGKTETAKALAEFLYGDPRRLIRIDMSEFAEYGAAERLIRGNRSGEGLLTSKIRQQPFSVLLLDEFEKAHEEVFDLLLQVLGEGRLTDAAGRVADFRNCVILMTSNLGVERFGLPRAGFDSPEQSNSARAAVSHFTAEASRLLRPEMMNRIDRIVPFHPLSRDSLRKILDIQLARIRRRHGLSARSLTLEIDPAVYDRIAQIGYEPRFGARPLRRVLERELLLPLAGALRRYPVRMSLAVRAFLEGDAISVAVSPESGYDRLDLRRQAERNRLGPLSEFRRRVRRLNEHSVVEEMKGRIRRGEAIRKRTEKRRGKGHPIPVESARFLDRVEQVDVPRLRRIENLETEIVRCEERALLDYFRDEPAAWDFASLEKEYDLLVFSLFEQEHERRDHVLLVTYGKSPESTEELLRLYENAAGLLGFRTTRYGLETCVKPEHLDAWAPGDAALFNVPAPDEQQVLRNRFGRSRRPSSENWKDLQARSIQVVNARRLDPGMPKTIPGRSQPAQLLEIRGARAGHLFGDEFGKHRLLNAGPRKQTFECSVEVSMQPLELFFPRIDSRGGVRISDPVIRRTVDFAAKVRGDVVCDAESLRDALEARLENMIEDWLDE